VDTSDQEGIMQTVIAVLLGAALATATVSGIAWAGDDKKPAQTTTQGERMKTCSKEAGDKHLKGDERRHFMSECLKGTHLKEHPEKRS